MNFFKVQQLLRQMKTVIVILVASITTLSGMCAMADDTEIFYGNSATASSPNIMLILDTSGSMNTLVTTAIPYDPNTDYSSYGTCGKDNIYYTTSSSTPACATTPYISKTAFYCTPATNSGGAFDTAGTYVDNAIRWTTINVTTTVSTTAPVTTTTSKTTHVRYTASSSASSSLASSSSSSSSTGNSSSSSSSNRTYTWQSSLNISSSSSSAPSSSSSSSSTSSVSSSASSINVTSNGKTYKTQVDTTTTNSTTKSTTTTSYAITRTVGDVTCSTNDPSVNGYPNNVSPTSGTEWTTTSVNSYWSTGGLQTNYHFYTGNFLNYKKSPQTSSKSRISIMQDAISSLLNSASGVNVGLMRYNSGGNGGMVVEPIQSINTIKNTIISDVNSWGPASDTPLSETLYEAYLYFTGGTVNFGKNSRATYCHDWDADHVCNTLTETTSSAPSVAASRIGSSSSASSYKSPMNYTCQKNYVVYLTDGAPNGDTAADSLIDGLSNTDAACYTSDSAMWSSLGYPTPSTTGGRCTAVLTKFMYNNDLSSSLDTTQNVTTYFVGLGSEAGGGGPLAYLEKAAIAGGGHAYPATDLSSLSTVFNKIFDSIKTDASTFTSPAVAVNAFNKTQVLNDLYISVFQPSGTRHWPGNLKKYKLNGGQIIDLNGNPAVSATTGFIGSTAQDFWSTSANQNNLVTVGGAANQIPAPSARTVYTFIGSNPSGPAAMQNFDASNTNLTAAVLGTTSALHDTLIAWAQGQDTDDDNSDGSTSDTRHVMGDPIHSQPQVVIYGNDSAATTTAEKLNDAVVYTLTNDGYLHAIDVSSGEELWSFIPQDALSNLSALYANDVTDTKHYILDGNIRVVKWDVNGDGVVDTSAGDKVFLFFSQGRGGSHYYALDVTNKTTPKFMWNIGPAQLPDIGESWSTPTVGKVNINGASQNTQKMVLIFAGGYDEATEDSGSYAAGDNSGRALYMVDAVTGAVLWSGGFPSIGASQSFAGMDHAIPSDVTIIDTNGDGYTDRIYVGDMAGQLWRFDITNGSAASSLVTGGVIASLGTHDDSTHPDANNRRFYNAPDVALFTSRAQKSYYNISIGSGYRGHPKNTATTDRLYAIRDYSPFVPLSSYTKVTDDQLDDITSNVYAGTVPTLTANTPGWKLTMNTAGEKILNSSITVQGTVMFTSYIPTSLVVSCSPSSGTARTYAINVNDGTIKFNTAYETHAISGLPANIQVINNSSLISSDGSGTGNSSSSSSGTSSSSASSSSSSAQSCTALNGLTILSRGVCPGQRIKTLWKEKGAN